MSVYRKIRKYQLDVGILEELLTSILRGKPPRFKGKDLPDDLKVRVGALDYHNGVLSLMTTSNEFPTLPIEESLQPHALTLELTSTSPVRRPTEGEKQ
jgi:hypothetical protein